MGDETSNAAPAFGGLDFISNLLGFSQAATPSILPMVPSAPPVSPTAGIPDLAPAPTPVPVVKQDAVATNTAAKQHEVAQAGADKRASLGPSEQDFQEGVIGRLTGAGVSTSSQFGKDFATLPWGDIHAKYGPEVTQHLIDVSNQREREDKAGSTALGKVGDAVSGLGLSALGIAGDATGFLASAVSPHLGGEIFQGTRELSEQIGKVTQTQKLQDSVANEAARSALVSRDNEARYHTDIGTYGKYPAMALREARNFGDAVESTLSDPTLAANATFSGLGSLLVGGPEARGLEALGKFILPEAVAALKAGAAADKAAGVMSARRVGQALVPSSGALSLGIQEATGAAAETSTKILETPTDKLAQISPQFRQMIAPTKDGGLGMDPVEARERLASNAAMAAAIPAGVGGVMVSKVTGQDKIIKHPFHVPSLGVGFGNAARETAFEGLQSGTGKLSSNVVQQQMVDPNQDILEDMGHHMGVGAVAGLGGAGVTEGPQMAGHALYQAARLAGRGVLGAAGLTGDALQAKADAAAAAAAAASPLAEATVAAQTHDLATNAPTVAQSAKDAIEQSSATPEAKAEDLSKVSNVLNAVSFGPSAYEGQPQGVVDALTGATNLADAAQRLAKIINETPNDQPTEDSVNAANLLHGWHTEIMEAVGQDIDGLKSLPADHPVNQTLAEYREAIKKITQSPSVAEALVSGVNQIKAAHAEGLIQPVTAESLATPEGQANAKLALTHLAVDPANANPATVEALSAHSEVGTKGLNLERSENGKLQLTPAQNQALMAAKSVVDAMKAEKAEQTRLGITDNSREVSNQIRTETSPVPGKESATQHATNIYQALRRGDLEGAKYSLSRLANLAEGLRNKTQAFNESHEAGDGKNITYRAFNANANNGRGAWYEAKKTPVFVRANNETTVRTAQNAALDAQYATDLHNNMLKAFPELQGTEAEHVALHSDLQGDASAVAQRFSNGAKPAVQEKAASTEAKSEAALRPGLPKDATAAEKAAFVEQTMTAPGKSASTLRNAVNQALEAGHADVAQSISDRVRAMRKSETDNYARLANEQDAKIAKAKPTQAEAKQTSTQEEETPAKSKKAAEEDPKVAEQVAKAEDRLSKAQDKLAKAESALAAEKKRGDPSSEARGAVHAAKIEVQSIKKEISLLKNPREETDRTPSTPLEEALAMTEEEYIRTVNPTGDISGEDVSMRNRDGSLADPEVLELPSTAKEVKTVGDITIYRDDHGVDTRNDYIRFWAVKDGKVVGYYGKNLGSPIMSFVDPSMRKRGIGTLLAKEFLRENPFVTATSFSPAGERARLSAFRALKAEQRAEQEQSRRGEQAEQNPTESNSEQTPAETSAAEAKTVQEKFPNLVGHTPGAKGRLVNLLSKAYGLPKEARTRIANSVSPLRDLWLAFRSSESVTSWLSDGEAKWMHPDVLKALRDHLALGKPILEQMNARLQAALSEVPSDPFLQDTFMGDLAKKKIAALSPEEQVQQFASNKRILKGKHPDLLAKFEEWKAKSTSDGSMAEKFAQFLGEYERNQELYPESFKTKDTRSIKERLLDGDTDLNGWSEYKILNLIEFDEETQTFHYNRAIQEAAILASLQWVLTLNNTKSEIDPKAAASILGINEDEVTSDDLAKLNQGITLLTAVNSLAPKIERYINLSRDKSVSDGIGRGITEGLAKEMIQVMSGQDMKGVTITGKKMDMLRQEPIPFRGLGENGDVNRTVIILSPKERMPGDPVLAVPDAIEKMVMHDPEHTVYFSGDKLPPASKTQLHQPLVQNSAQQQQAIDNANKTEHFLNRPLYDLYSLLKLDNLLSLLASRDPKDLKLNKNHAESLKGKRQMVSQSWSAMQERYTALAQRAAEAEVPMEPEQLGMHFLHNINSVNRLQQLGSVNGQANKLHRALILPTWSEVDVSKAGTKAHNQFFLGLAQGLGVKVNKQSIQQSVAEVQKLLEGKLAKPVADFKAFLNGEEIDGHEITASLIEAFGAGKVSNEAMQSIMEFARYEIADAKERSNFRTSTYVEADGVTNGPIMAMMLLAHNKFTPEWLRNMGKGGLFAKNPDALDANGEPVNPTTMNNWFTKGDDGRDLYEASVENSQRHFRNLAQEVTKIWYGKGTKQLDALKSVITTFLPGVAISAEDGSFILDRKVAKNPLTITIYGSGEAGIAGKLTATTVSEIYERMSDAAQRMHEAKAKGEPITVAVAMFGDGVTVDVANARFEEFVDSLNQLTSTTTIRKGKGPKTFLAVVGGHGQAEGLSATTAISLKTLADLLNFTLDPKQLVNLRGNMHHLFVAPLRAGINDTLGSSVVDGASLLRKAGQIQSQMQEDLFNRLVQEKLEQNSKSDPRAKLNGLSQNEKNEILTQVLRKFPIITTGTQNFLPASASSTEVDGTEFSRTLDGRLSTPGSVSGFADAGVATTPYLVIGTGDGQTVQSTLTSKAPPVGSLMIFDGMNFRLINLSEDGVKANQGVNEAWKGNPISAVYQALKASIDNVDLNNASPELLQKLVKSLSDYTATEFETHEGSAPLSAEELKTLRGKLQSLQDEMQAAGVSVEARSRALAEHRYNVDQMAAIGSPFENQGKVLDGTPQEIVNSLNEAYYRHLEAIHEETGYAHPDMPGAAVEASETVSKGVADPLSKVLVMTHDEMVESTDTSKLGASQKVTFAQIVKSGAAKGYTIIHGTEAQARAYLASKGLTEVNLKAAKAGDFVSGKVDTGNKVIWINTRATLKGQTEALVHELVHAATAETLLNHYTDPTSSKGQVSTAIKNLEGLMNQFAKLNPELHPEYDNLMEKIGNIIAGWERASPVEKTTALNEFMAWGLANEKLAALQKGTKASDSVLARFAASVQKGIRSLMRAIGLNVGEDMLSHLQFNTAVLAQRAEPTLYERASGLALFMSQSFGTNERLARDEEFLNRSVTQHINDPAYAREIAARADKPRDPVGAAKFIRENEHIKIQTEVAKLALDASAIGFDFTQQARSAMISWVAALAAQTLIDPRSMLTAQKVYDHFIKTVKVSDFSGPNAQAKFDFMLGKGNTIRDDAGRSALLPVFLAMVRTNEEVRAIAEKMALPKDVLPGWGTFEGVIDRIGNLWVENLSNALAGTKRDATVMGAIDPLAERMRRAVDERQNLIDQDRVSGGFNLEYANEVTQQGLRGVVGGLRRGTESIEKRNSNKLTRTMNNLAHLAEGFVDSSQADILKRGAVSFINSSGFPAIMKDIGLSMSGRTKSNSVVYDMMKITKGFQKIRNLFRTTVENAINNRFTQPQTSETHALMHRGLAKTDLATVAEFLGTEKALDLLAKPGELSKAIQALEASIQAANPADFNLTQRKMKQLAEYMNTGKGGNNLLSNARAVAHLRLERRADPKFAPTESYINEVDHLTSLYALEALSAQDKAGLVELAQKERPALDYTLSVLQGLRAEERRKVESGTVRFSYLKGHVPALNKQGAHMIIARDSDYLKLTQASWTRNGNYSGSNVERNNHSEGYYYREAPTQAPFAMGLMQNANQTAGGVDSATGFSMGTTAGRITHPPQVAAITRVLAREGATNEPLRAIFDFDGNVLAYERMADPAKLAGLAPETNLAKLAGEWMGRQFEEAGMGEMNKQVIDASNKMYQDDLRDSKAHQKEYVDILDPNSFAKDPVLAKAVSLMPPATVAYAKKVTGQESFFVRKDMLENVLGYHQASVGDLWTGNSRWSDEHQKAIKNIAIAVWGNDAYAKLTNYEAEWQSIARSAKEMIVVKSMVVPAIQLVGNMYDLFSMGVNPVYATKGIAAKVPELHAYERGMIKVMELRLELGNAKDEATKTRITAQINNIEDSHKRMSIWPLIQAGELSSVSDTRSGGHTAEEMTGGKLQNYLTQQIEKLPPGLKQAAKLSLVTKDTALFQALSKSVEYSDFLSKAVYYDHLTQRRKMTKDQALDLVSNHYVNGDWKSGRALNYMEKMGTVWFPNYKLRRTAVALSVFHTNPLHSIMATFLPAASEIGLPMWDNAASEWLRGEFRGIGPRSLFRAPTLLPLYRILVGG